MIQNLWNAAKAQGKFLTIQAYIRKQEKSQINNLKVTPKGTRKKEQTNLRARRRDKIMKKLEQK